VRSNNFPPKQGQRQLREHTIQRSTLTRSGRLLAANMLGDLLSKAAGHGGTAAELEAMTAERDFFREKYTEQMMKMSAMEEILSENQRIIHKLRGEILAAKKQQQQQCQQQNSDEGATTTTSSSANVITDDEDFSRRHDDTDNDEDGYDDKDNESHPETSASNNNRDSSSSDNEADEIRANAERMLQWAQYQSTKKSSSSESSLTRRQQQNSSSCLKSDGMKVVNISAKSLVDMDSDQDRDTSVTKEGKMSKLFDNMRDVISPSVSSDDDDDEECESADESSSCCERNNDKLYHKPSLL
jgi:hypothetical protein